MNPTSPDNLWVRYTAAIIVAFIVSVATMVACGVFCASFQTPLNSSPTLFSVIIVMALCLTGFNGVHVGSQFLPRRDRFVGAIGLLVLGICFEVLILGLTHNRFHIPLGAYATGFGGLLAVVVQFSRKWNSRA